MTQKPTSTPRPSDKWIPWYLVLGFLALLVPLAPMAYYAVHTLPGVVTENAYEKGIAYNKAIARGAEEQALGWQGDVTLEAGGQGAEAHATYVLRDAQAQPIDGASVHAWLVRPSQGGMDRDVVLKGEGGGRYSAAVVLPERGLWDVRVSASRQDKNFQTEKRIVVP